MEFEFTDSKKDQVAYLSARRDIVTLYNKITNHNEIEVFTDQEILDLDTYNGFTLRVKGMTGGITVEKLIGNERATLVTYAALSDKDQGKGLIKTLLRKCQELLDQGQHNTVICAIQMNDTDNRDIWKHLGFTEAYGIANGTTALVDPKLLEKSQSLPILGCDHVVACYGNRLIRDSEFLVFANEFTKKVFDFNLAHQRGQVVTPPAELQTAAFCTECGKPINQNYHNQIIRQYFINEDARRSLGYKFR
ncbi:hypothetical protein [Photobacterium damselae]|uniref:hypothetical protein n=1 Tax=Photobacterium damselae TaxID=38293 RepID=UPI0040692DF8